jgi:hypothetical protein
VAHHQRSNHLSKKLEKGNLMNDPTYVKATIEASPVWRLAFRLSEVDNDNAPIGWYEYAPLARWLLKTFELIEKPQHGD